MSLNYQPIFSISTGKLVGLEALARWLHPEKGWISPGLFIPIAEETRLIVPLGEWVLAKACQQLKLWQDMFPHLGTLVMSVNISGVQFWHSDILQSIDHALQECSLSGGNLKLEITESVVMKKEADAVNLMEEFKKRNIQLALDDFGTGYSSLAYLKSFPVDTLKIDRSFVNGIEEDQTKLDIARTILSLAHTLALDVVAEGIETQAQLDILKSLSCDNGQGYFLSRPLDEENITKFLESLSS